MKYGTVLGGQGKSWNYGVIVKGRILFAEELEIEALVDAAGELEAEAGGQFVIVVPVDRADDAEEVEIVAGVPVAMAVVDDDSDDTVAVDVSVEGTKEALARSLPDSFWDLVAEKTGLEVVPDSEGVYLAPGGRTSVTLEMGEQTVKAYSENDPPHEALGELTDGRLVVTYS